MNRCLYLALSAALALAVASQAAAVCVTEFGKVATAFRHAGVR